MKMGIFDGILIITDLDGTLLRSDKSVSAENKAAIAHFVAQGGKFTFITGRAPCGTAPVLAQITPNAPIGCHNGGGIYDTQRREYIYKRRLDESAMQIVEAVDRELPEVGIEVFGFEHIYFAKKSAATEKHRRDENLEDIPCDYKNLPEEAAKILFAARGELITKLDGAVRAHALAGGFDFIRSDDEYFEILPKGSCKGNLLIELASILGIAVDRTVAVGDNDNDVSMLEAAGVGIAVANASAAARAAADIITVSNEEHAIARIIGDIEQGKIKL